jgi:hypothetical protein
MKALTLEPTIFYQLLADDEFYTVVPPSLATLEEQARKARQDALNVALGKACAGCSSVRDVLMPIMDEYGRQLSVIHQADPEALNPLVDYISRKRGFRPTPIVLYYREVNGKTTRLIL